MITPYQPSHLEPLISLWLASTIDSHPFISPEYWYSCQTLVRDFYLPSAKTWVYHQDNQLCGFISILEEKLLGGLFVSGDYQHQGIGKALVKYVQQHYSFLLLEVYQLNQGAYNFYLQQGFHKVCEYRNEETQHIVNLMQWTDLDIDQYQMLSD